MRCVGSHITMEPVEMAVLMSKKDGGIYLWNSDFRSL
jgi:hypothetical protein